LSVRVFVALTPSELAVEHLDDAVAPAREQHSELRWVDPSRWHLTLAFLGDVDEVQLPELQVRLARAASRHDSASLRLRGAGAFARPARATVLWAGVEAPVRLGALAASCAAAGRRLGLDVDDRAHRPHLTLARARSRSPVDVRTLVEVLGGYEGPNWTASDVMLMRSHLGPQPRYEELARWPLRAETD
jgi:2'-5' RNA ligase